MYENMSIKDCYKDTIRRLLYEDDKKEYSLIEDDYAYFENLMVYVNYLNNCLKKEIK